MFHFPVGTPHDPVAVEYDRAGVRVRKVFKDPAKARRFYVRKSDEGKEPHVVTTHTRRQNNVPRNHTTAGRNH